MSMLPFLPTLLGIGWTLIKFLWDQKKQAADNKWALDMDTFWKAVDHAKAVALAQTKEDSSAAQKVEDVIDKQKRPEGPVVDMTPMPVKTKPTNAEDVIDAQRK